MCYIYIFQDRNQELDKQIMVRRHLLTSTGFEWLFLIVTTTTAERNVLHRSKILTVSNQRLLSGA